MLEEQQKQVLLDMKFITDSLQIPMLVVGAGARILVFDKRYKIEGRATLDLDFAIKLDNWSDFEVLKVQMTQGHNPLFKVTRLLPRGDAPRTAQIYTYCDWRFSRYCTFW